MVHSKITFCLLQAGCKSVSKQITWAPSCRIGGSSGTLNSSMALVGLLRSMSQHFTPASSLLSGRLEYEI